jgi:hypothetical protein
MNRAANLFLFGHNNKKIALLISAGLLFFNAGAQHEMRGLVFEHDRYNALPLPLHYGKTEKVPAEASLKPYLPRVITQFSANTAVSWSVVWYANTVLDAKLKGIKAGQAEHRKLPLSPGFNYRKVQKKAGCDSPVSMIDVLESLQHDGAPHFAEYTDYCPADLSEDILPIAQNKLSGYVRLFNSYDTPETKVHALKKALAFGSPVVIGIICPPSFEFAEEFWQPREPDALESYGGHALCVYGYSDETLGGAFEVVNTWGPQWGKEGETWIRYEDLAKHMLYGFQLLGAAMPMEASVAFTTADGNPMTVSKTGGTSYTINNTYNTGDKFKFSVRTRKGVFFSVAYMDGKGQTDILFPSDTTTNSFITSSLSLPNDYDFFTLTEPAGKNRMYFVFSASENVLKQTMKAVLKKETVFSPDPKLSKWSEDTVQFESSQELVVVTVELNQH